MQNKHLIILGVGVLFIVFGLLIVFGDQEPGTERPTFGDQRPHVALDSSNDSGRIVDAGWQGVGDSGQKPQEDEFSYFQ